MSGIGTRPGRAMRRLFGRGGPGRAGLVVLAALAAADARPQSGPPAATYPSRPVNLYIGSAPSGSTDALGRVLARSLESELGEPVVVHNTPGAGGAVMATQLLNSAADGYSLGMTISHAYTGNPIVMPDSTRYSVDDFTHLASVSKGQCALVTASSRPYAGLDDVIEAARQGRQPVYASQSPLTRIVADYIAQAAGVRFKVITVQGGGEIMQSILGGHADFGFSGGPHVDFVEAGQMRVLASVEDARLITSPEVPTLRELGYDIASCSTFVVSAPPGLPSGITSTLAQALQRAIASPAVTSLIRNLKYPEYYLGPEDITRTLVDESRMLARAVERIRASADAPPSADLSPSFMPYVAASTMLGAFVLLIAGWLRDGAGPVPAGSARIDWRFVAGVLAVMPGAFLAMSALGYIPGGTVIVIGFMLLGRAEPKVIVVSALLLPLTLWLLFSKLLGFPLP